MASVPSRGLLAPEGVALESESLWGTEQASEMEESVSTHTFKPGNKEHQPCMSLPAGGTEHADCMAWRWWEPGWCAGAPRPEAGSPAQPVRLPQLVSHVVESLY